ncbi:olfactory receptor 6N2-like [Rhinatrema bivittatum]|uniref:olfactory receptor 6N2-like n=1 Tax=Rhinatrema bivittatum TaxID=194408 RepID=UPI00112E7B71|nr:olfactory receptor 6N2-like [Rhinatrema bivittatum]
MDELNQTTRKDFIILGFSSFPQLEFPLFLLILLVYLVTLSGNFVIIILVRMELSLHSPMYIFISILSCLEILYVSVTVPKLLANLLSVDKTISYVGCFTQLYLFHSLGISECMLLVMMAFDRYLAICNPLRYKTIMTNKLCILLGAFSWLIGSSSAIVLTIFTTRLPFCSYREINHFFCDLTPLVSLACSDTSVNIVLNSSFAVCLSTIPFFFICFLYIKIIIAILKIKTAEGRHKAFSTCSSHLIVVTLFYGSALIVYVRPMWNIPAEYDKFLALMYTVLTPSFNPFIYSLRNNEMKGAGRNLYRKLGADHQRLMY